MPVETRYTACNRDCPDACSLKVTVDDGRAIRLQGDSEDPITRGFLCQRTSRFLSRQYDDNRIVQPRLRVGEEWKDISWDEALSLAASKLEHFKSTLGPSSILHYRSGGSLGILKSVADLMFAQFGPVTIKHGDICSGAGEFAQEKDFGVSESHDLDDLKNSRTIVLWGKNPHVSGVHLLPHLKEAKKRGACILGIDPVKTPSSNLCDHFLWVKPGSDYEVAMAVVRWLFEHDAVDPSAASYCDHFEEFRALAMEKTLAERAKASDLDESALRRFAELFGKGAPASILVGWGLARRKNGAKTVRALDGLGAISGNLGVPGGGVSYYFGRRTAFDSSFGISSQRPPRTLSEPLLGREILEASDPPIKMIWVTAGNPVSMLPDSDAVRKAFLKSEFNVVVDTHPTDTTDLAHLVLPTLTLLEDDDLLGSYGNHFLRVSRPVIDPPGGARHEVEILCDLARRLSLGEVWNRDVHAWKRSAMKRLESVGITTETMEEKRATLNPFREFVLFKDRRFPTASGRVQLLDQSAKSAPSTTPEFPMTLLPISTPRAQSSQWSVDPGKGPAEVRVHPSRAESFGDSAEAYLESSRGRLHVIIRVDETVRPDVALMEKGGMYRQGRCVNHLINAEETDEGSGAAYYDELVRLIPLG